MIIICNGAFKSGSTWLFNIVRHLGDFETIPNEWRNPKWRNPSIDPDKLEDFIKTEKPVGVTYLSKNHLSNPEFVGMLSQRHVNEVKILNIRRDIRDVIVSAFYHYQRVDDYDEPFDVFFRNRGWKVGRRVIAYNEQWDTGSENNFFTSYENLQSDITTEIIRIADFLDLEITQDTAEDIAARTAFGSWKEITGSAHLRKGVVGDWKNYMDSKDIKFLRKKLDNKGFDPAAD